MSGAGRSWTGWARRTGYTEERVAEERRFELGWEAPRCASDHWAEER